MIWCFESDVSSAEDLAAARTAIELCHSSALKKEVLCAAGSEYDRYKSRYDTERNTKVWKETLENKTTKIFENLGLPRVLHEKLTSLVILIGMRMLTWAKYHEGILCLTREYSIKFLNSSFFTPQGIIDSKKAAEELLKDSSLKTKQKYTLACLYCFTEHIPDLFRQMSQEEKENIGQGINYSEMVTFWSDYLMGEIDKFRGEKTLEEYMLEKAIESGSKAAVEYCLEETSLKRKKGAVIDAALQTVLKITEIYPYLSIFSDFVFNGRLKLISGDCFVDILCFLLAKMNEEQKIDFLKKDIEHTQDQHVHPRSRVLIYFLDLPYQNYFMRTAKLMWEFLPEKTYAELLLKICNNINPGIKDLKNVEEKRHHYQKLLKEFWCQSPDHYKRYVFSDKEATYWIGGRAVIINDNGYLIVKLFTLKSDTYEDRKIFEVIFESATEEEKERIISSKEGKDICIGLMEGEKWEILDRFLSGCIFSKDEAEEYKRKLSFTKEARRLCANFIKYKWDAAEFFIKWSSLSEKEITRFKRELIYSRHGKWACWHLFLYKSKESADRFCEWCFCSEEEIRKFKVKMIVSLGPRICLDAIMKDELEVFDKFINWSNLSIECIKVFKKHLQNEQGNYICESLISGNLTLNVFYHTHPFRGGKWEQVEKFLTWCFSTEEEIEDFKKNRILKISGAKINFRLIEWNQMEEAETFFAWLGLSTEEVKELKKETLFKHIWDNIMSSILMYGRYDDFSFYGSRQETIELLLRWYLTDKETVIEFRDHFKQECQKWEMRNDGAVRALKDFDSAIEQRLSDLDEEQRESRRKSKLSKDLCDVELENSRTAELQQIKK